MIRVLRGDFLTGNVDRNNTLPALKGSTGVVDINGAHTLTFDVEKAGLPSTKWTDIIKRVATFVIVEDTSKPWNHPYAVRHAGFVNKANGNLKDAIKIQSTSFFEYCLVRAVSPVMAGTVTDPNAGITFSGKRWSEIQKKVIQDMVSLAETPQVLGDFIIQDNTPEADRSVSVLLSEKVYYGPLLERIRDELSEAGMEFNFFPRWESAAKNKVVYDVRIEQQINFNKNKEIRLAEDDFNTLEMSLNFTSESMANRIIGQSKTGDYEKKDGADYTVQKISNGLPLMDTIFIPNVELTEAEMKSQLKARLQDAEKPKGAATWKAAMSFGDAMELLGSRLTFVGKDGTISEGYSVHVRCTGFRYTLDSDEIEFDIMLPQFAYPKLPSSTKRTDLGNNGGYGPGYGNGGIGSGGGPGTIGGGGNTSPGGNYQPPVIVPPGGVTPPNPNLPVDEFNARKLATNGGTTLAISEDNKLFGWGNNGSGTVGVGYDKNDIGNVVIVPKEVIADENPDKRWIAVFTPTLPNGGAAYAIDDDEVLWGWGLMPSVFGEEEGTDLVPIEKPILLAENASDLMQYENYGIGNVNYPGGVYILKGDGRLFGIGTQPFGSASGTSTKEHPLVPWPNADERFTKISSNNFWHTALNSNGEVYEWGTYTNHGFEPVKLKNDVRFKDIHIGFGNFAGSFKMGITEDNSLYVWGNGPYGGDTPGSSLEPQRHTQIDKVAQFTPSYFATHIVLPDGTLWAAGNNTQGQLGVGIDTPSQFSKFIQVGEDDNWLDAFWSKPVAEGGTWVIKSNGELWVWGINDYGQQGTGDGVSHATAFRVGEDSDWIRVSGQRFGALAVKAGKMMITGYNNQGQLGNNTLQPYTAWTRQDGTVEEDEES